ncbi:hypothetical protein [Actinomadura alba]|uniref:Uncharacterized protein n=1 Tax=Actinomadura alba TaxID=406431 RepID=A0ABR7M2M1_9ACTN|nr:hypothetical protein [Actinomadura alba]MBC6470965.1 hypothetical protein [Actinomadura alba]
MTAICRKTSATESTRSAAGHPQPARSSGVLIASKRYGRVGRSLIVIAMEPRTQTATAETVSRVAVPG